MTQSVADLSYVEQVEITQALQGFSDFPKTTIPISNMILVRSLMVCIRPK